MLTEEQLLAEFDKEFDALDAFQKYSVKGGIIWGYRKAMESNAEKELQAMIHALITCLQPRNTSTYQRELIQRASALLDTTPGSEE